MREGTRTALLEEGRVDEGFVKRAVAAAAEATPGNRVRAGLETLIAMAEDDRANARSALRELRTDHVRLRRLEAWLGGDPQRATLGVGAAIQIAAAELDSPDPDFERLTPELLHWLEGRW
ncbi:MAG TPA: hypothetical protein VH703_01175 [Solirubrobacterales bacterium]|jgi:hypothetical protein